MLAFNILALFTALSAFSASASPIPAGALLSGLEANALPSSLTPSTVGLDGRQLSPELNDLAFILAQLTDVTSSLPRRQHGTYNSVVSAASIDTASLIKRLDLVGNNAAGPIADNSAYLAKRVVLAGAAGDASDGDLSPKRRESSTSAANGETDPASASLIGRDTAHELYIGSRGELKADTAAGADLIWE